MRNIFQAAAAAVLLIYGAPSSASASRVELNHEPYDKIGFTLNLYCNKSLELIYCSSIKFLSFEEFLKKRRYSPLNDENPSSIPALLRSLDLDLENQPLPPAKKRDGLRKRKSPQPLPGK